MVDTYICTVAFSLLADWLLKLLPESTFSTFLVMMESRRIQHIDNDSLLMLLLSSLPYNHVLVDKTTMMKFDFSIFAYWLMRYSV